MKEGKVHAGQVQAYEGILSMCRTAVYAAQPGTEFYASLTLWEEDYTQGNGCSDWGWLQERM